jgi:peptide/nickel transport system substrate-binding protein
MRTIWRTLIQPVYIPFVDTAEDAYRAFSSTGRALFLFFSVLLIISAAALVYLLNASLLVTVPARGGTLSEGIIGSPRFINPVLAISDADRDAVSLVYSGLLKATPDGNYVSDLAQDYVVSDDGKTYTFTLRPHVTFHDGTPVTADDVVFTVMKAQDPALKSPLRANWDGVTVEKVDERTLRFTLKQLYAPFIANLTIGILPKHLWQNVSTEEFPFSELNTSPVGSGPYKVTSISRTASGIPSSYELQGFSAYALGEPYLSHLTLRLYQSESALMAGLEAGDIESASGISPEALTPISGSRIERSPLNRVFGVFFNQNQSEILRDKDVRQALGDSIDRQILVDQVLGGFGTPLLDPIPRGILPRVASTATSTIPSSASQGPDTNLALAAQARLLTKGWSLGSNQVLTKTTGKGKDAKTVTLSFSLSTGNVPELRAAAEYLREQWSTMGVSVDVKIFDQGDLSQNVIRPRKYDALLFGEVVGREFDLYAFWHSSQRNDPGLNVALYANATADKILEQLRSTGSDQERADLYGKFRAELNRDIPALFLYTPDFVYTVPKDLKGLDLGFIGTPSDRFLSITQWHRETDYVWPFFAK